MCINQDSLQHPVRQHQGYEEPSPTTETTVTTGSAYYRGQRISGQVVSIDQANNSLVLRDDQGQSHTIKVDSSTSFTGDPGVSINNLSDLKSGDRVVAVMKADKTTMASSISISKTTTRSESATTMRTPSDDRSRETTATTEEYASAGRVSGTTGELPRTATPLPLIGAIGLLILSVGAIVRKIVG